MTASVRCTPWSLEFRAQFERARSMSGNLPLVRLIGEELFLFLEERYFSFWRKTLETVLDKF